MNVIITNALEWGTFCDLFVLKDADHFESGIKISSSRMLVFWLLIIIMQLNCLQKNLSKFQKEIFMIIVKTETFLVKWLR